MWNLIFSTSSVMPRYVSYLFLLPLCWADRLVHTALLNKHQIGFFDPYLIQLSISHILLRIAAQSWEVLLLCTLGLWPAVCSPTYLYNLKSYHFPQCIPVSVNFSLSPVSGFLSTFPPLRCSCALFPKYLHLIHPSRLNSNVLPLRSTLTSPAGRLPMGMCSDSP